MSSFISRKRIQLTIGTACSGAVIFMALFCQAKPKELTRIRAVVNGEPITQLEVDSALQTQVRIYLMGNKGQISRSKAERDIRAMDGKALKDIIDQKLILSEFKRLGGEIKGQYIDESIDKFIKDRFGGDKEKFASELKKSGMSIAQFREIQRDQIAVHALTSQNVKDDGVQFLTKKAKQDMYNEIKGQYTSEGRVKLRMLSIPKKTADRSMEQQKELVKSIRSKLVNGEDFASLAKEYSQDSFAGKGGYVGVIGKQTLNPGLTQFAYRLSRGEVSQPIDDGPFWRLMKSEGRIGQSVPSYEDLLDTVEERLRAKKFQERRDDWLKKLRRDANVRIYD